MAAKKVTIMVGFVPIATKIEVAVEEETSGTHAVCTGTPENPHDPSRVKMTVGCQVCPASHSSVWGFGQRGVERDGQLVVLSNEEIAAAAGTPRTGRAGKHPIQVAFHPREKVEAATLASDSVQNIYPDKGGEKAYALLRDSLAAHPDIVACMIWAPTSKNALWTLGVNGHRIVATKRCWPEQVRPTVEVPMVDYVDLERDMFDQLITTTVEDFDLLTYVDESKRSLDELIASRASDGTLPPVPSGGAVPQVTNLIASLEASLEALGATKPAKKAAPKKRAPAKKAAAKKAAPRKRAASKPALSKSA